MRGLCILLGHRWELWHTSTQTGIETLYCKRCGARKDQPFK